VYWWQRNIVEPGKLPLLLSLAAFVVTFVVTRIVTRLIRAGRSWFHDHISESGIHIHHAVPGILLLVAGAFAALGTSPDSTGHCLAAIAIGTGTSLVLDEFASILNLRDVYWSTDGRISVEMVALAVACIGFTLVGVSPFGIDNMGSAEIAVRTGALVASVTTAVLVIVCVLKGKLRLALFGMFVPFVAWIGALRLARPNSPWARRRYNAQRRERSRRRATATDARWTPMFDRISDAIAGRPTYIDENAEIPCPLVKPSRR